MNKNSDLATPEQLERKIYPAVILGLQKLLLEFDCFAKGLKDPDAQEHCFYGLSRRIITLKNCLKRVLEISPPTRSKKLDQKELIDLTAHLHCFFINNSGIYNNFAWIWFYEKLPQEEQEVVSKHISNVNLFKRAFQKYLPMELVGKCKQFSRWMKYVNNFRDPLAHKIPFYVIPYFIEKQNVARYNELKKQLQLALDLNERNKIVDEMDSLGVYLGCIAGSFSDKRVLTIHQIVADVNTLLDFSRCYIKVFDDKKSSPWKLGVG